MDANPRVDGHADINAIAKISVEAIIIVDGAMNLDKIGRLVVDGTWCSLNIVGSNGSNSASFCKPRQLYKRGFGALDHQEREAERRSCW